MTYEVTIGIPVFDKEKYILSTIDSALAQTYKSIEFLVLDDGGTDQSMDIVREYQLRHPRGNDIRIVSHLHNMGVGEARNRILDEARGKYLFFLDADDTIDNNTIELLVNTAKKYDAQVVMGSYEKIDFINDTISRNLYQLPSKVFQGENAIAIYAFHKYGALQANIWNVLMDLDFIRDCGIRFVNANFWEDLVFKNEMVTYVSRAVLLSDITYHYRCYENSLSRLQGNNEIPKSRILRNVSTVDVMKQQWKILLNKPYFPNWLNSILKTDFFIICYVLKNKQFIKPTISNSELVGFLKSPLSLFNTIRYGNVYSMFYKILSILPSSLSIGLIGLLQYFLSFSCLYKQRLKKKA